MTAWEHVGYDAEGLAIFHDPSPGNLPRPAETIPPRPEGA